jgi:hypothetical protein
LFGFVLLPDPFPFIIFMSKSYYSAYSASTFRPRTLMNSEENFPGRDDDITQSQDNEPTQIQDSLPAASAMSIEDWVDKLRCSDRAFYNIMAMEVWSLAKSMDTIEPGFWSRFMVNRRDAMQDFVERRRQREKQMEEEPTAGDVPEP